MSKASFSNLETDLDVIQKLDDLPNAVGGLSAADLKEQFDTAGNLIKAYINDTLLDELASEENGDPGASRIGISPIVGLTGTDNVQDALASILNVAQEGQRGVIGPNVITTAMIQDEAITPDKLDDDAVQFGKIAPGAVTKRETNFESGLSVGDFTANGMIILSPQSYGTYLPSPSVAGRLFFLKVQ